MGQFSVTRHVKAEQKVLPDQRTASGRNKPSTKLYARAIVTGIIAAIIMIGLIFAGSRGFNWFDPMLTPYAIATVFCVAAVAYKYTLWVGRPSTGRYWKRSFQLLTDPKVMSRFTTIFVKGVADLFGQQFIRRRGLYRWVMHQCIFWGVVLSCAIIEPLVFGWLRFTQTPDGLYRLWAIGIPLIALPVNSLLAFLLFHALDFTAALALIGVLLAFYRRFYDMAVITVQRFRFDIMPLVLLLAIAVTGLALTADTNLVAGAYYQTIALIHEAVVVIWLISIPFGKFFHIVERPATVGVEVYWRSGQQEHMQKCARCQEEYAPARFIQDLKKTLYDVGENFSLQTTAHTHEHGQAEVHESVAETETLWWQDLCPSCKRVMRAQANMAALGRSGNQFL